MAADGGSPVAPKRVAVVEGGMVRELSTHEELLSGGGSYADLWHAWHGD